MHPRAAELIRALDLVPHPEGGYYRETYRSPLVLDGLARGPRSALTVIYFLLHEGTFSALHRVTSDEVWHFYEGEPLELTLLDDDGRATTATLANDLVGGARPHVVVPAGTWQAAVPRGAYTLCGCSVAPGFDFADFAMPSRDELRARFPGHEALVTRLTRGS